MWNFSVSGTKLEIEQKLEQEVEKYKDVDYYDDVLKTIWPFVEANIGKYDDRQIITVKSNGGENVTFDAPFVHMLSVSVSNM